MSEMKMKHINGGASEAMEDTLTDMMRKDPTIVMYGWNVRSGISDCFIHPAMGYEFGPDRLMDMPVNENLIAYSSLGMAMAGLKPVVDLGIADFSTLMFDAFANNISKLRYWSHGKTNAQVTLIAAAGTGTRCGCTHSQCVEGWFCQVPGMKVVVPTDPADCKGLLRAAIEDPDPVYFQVPRTTFYYPCEIPEEQYSIPLGQSKVVREGTDVTIVAWQLALTRAKGAARDLEKEGISVEIIDPLTLLPLDAKGIARSVKKTGRLVVAHEAYGKYGPGAEIITEVSKLCYNDLKAAPERAATPFMAIPVFKVEDEFVVTKLDIKNAVYRTLGMPEKEFDDGEKDTETDGLGALDSAMDR